MSKCHASSTEQGEVKEWVSCLGATRIFAWGGGGQPDNVLMKLPLNHVKLILLITLGYSRYENTIFLII
jgi:hypothetical protein